MIHGRQLPPSRPLPLCPASLIVRIALVLGLFGVSLGAPSVADAAKKTVDPRAAIAASILAKSEMGAGNFGKAAALYDQAYRLDPKTLGYLYSAARAKQKEKRYDDAEKDFVAFLKLRAKAPKVLVERANKHLLEIRRLKGEDLRQRLDEAEKARKAAEEALKKNAANAAATKKADEKRSEDAAKKQAADAAKSAAAGDKNDGAAKATDASATLPPPKARPSGTPSMIALAVGSASLVVAVTFVSLAAIDNGNLEDGLNLPKGPPSMSEAEAEVLRQSVLDKNMVAYVTGGVGVVALGLGLWLRPKAEKVALYPTANGAGLLVRF